MSNQELIDLVLHGKEERNLEYKAGQPWSEKHFRAKIVRAVLGMSNIRDGGVIVIGVVKETSEYVPTGLTPEALATYDYDAVAAQVNKYAEPFADFTLTKAEYRDMRFAVLQVREFAEIPVVCKKDFPDVLRNGAVYTRSRRIHETVEISSQSEMRELLTMAVEKGMRGYLASLSEMGLFESHLIEDDAAKFREQLGEF